MSETVGMIIGGLITVTVNYIATFIIFTCRYNKRLSIAIAVLFIAVYYSFLYFSGLSNMTFGGFRGLLHLPLIVFLFRGQFFQKVFAGFLVMLLSGFQIKLVREVTGLLVMESSENYYVIFITILIAVYAAYLFLILKYGRRVFEKLFIDGRKREWALYSGAALFSFSITAIFQELPIDLWMYMLLQVFILCSFMILCFAIINTHEKTKQKADAEFAQNIVSSGRDHYEKMNELRDEISTMRHDYKYHLSAARGILFTGNQEEAANYLSGIEQQLSEKELPEFCANTAINALLASYAEHCAELNIKYHAQVILPEPLTISIYDMCIVFGNLLENAVAACEKLTDGRAIEVIANSRNEQFFIKVKNSYDGKPTKDAAQSDGLPASSKPHGGIGLKSIQAVAARYRGDLLIKSEAESFTAYVTLGL